MNLYTAERLVGLLASKQHVSVMLYLADYNPDVPVNTLSTSLCIPIGKASAILTDLVNVNIATVNDEQLFSLTNYGQFVVKRLHEINGLKQPPKQTQIRIPQTYM